MSTTSLMDPMEATLRERFYAEHDIEVDQYLGLMSTDDDACHELDDPIGFILAVHRVQMRHESEGLPTLPYMRGVHHVALLKAQHLGFFFYHRLDAQGRDALEVLDGLSAQPGWLPLRHYYDHLYDILMQS